MDKYGFYKEFIKSNKIKLGELCNKMHDLYAERNSIYKILEENKVLFEIFSMKFDNLSNMMIDPSYNKKIINEYARKNMPEYYRKLLYKLLNICKNRIPALTKEIEITAFLCNTPSKMYFAMQYGMNREIANKILRGDIHHFGCGLGKLAITYVKRGPNSKICIDWGESNKLKKRLINEGHTPKSKENPDGIKWILFHVDEGYCFWRWFKNKSIAPNKQMYRFRAIATNNESTDYKGAFTQEEILNKTIGPFDKMMALLKLNPYIKERYGLQCDK